jgi:hypothetical protein
VRDDVGLPYEAVPAVAEHEAPVVDLRVRLTLLRLRILDVEQVGEVGGGLQPNLHVSRFGPLVADHEQLHEPVGDQPFALDGQVGFS